MNVLLREIPRTVCRKNSAKNILDLKANHPEKVNEENLRAVVRRDPVQSARTLALGLDVRENTSLKYMLTSVEEVSRDLSENREQICRGACILLL